MVHTSSIAFFATVAIYVASPALGAALPTNLKPSASATTTTTTAPKPTSEADRLKLEKQLIQELFDLEAGSIYAPKPNVALKNLKKDEKKTTSTSTTSSTPTPTPTGKVLDKKLIEQQRQLKLHEDRLRLQQQQERLKLSKLDHEIELERLRIDKLDRERLLLKRPTTSSTTTSATPTITYGSKLVNNKLVKLGSGSSSSSSSSTTTAKATPTPVNLMQQAQQYYKEHKLIEDLERLVTQPSYRLPRDIEESDNWVRGYDNSENDARDNEEADNWVRGYDNSVNDARDVEEADNWVRGYDNSQNDARYVEEDNWVRGYDNSQYDARDVEDEGEFSRSEFEGLEDLD